VIGSGDALPATRSSRSRDPLEASLRRIRCAPGDTRRGSRTTSRTRAAAASQSPLHLLEKGAQRGRVRRVEHPGIREREDQQAQRRSAVPLLQLQQRRVRLGAVGRLQQDEPRRRPRVADEKRTQRAIRVERSEDVETGTADPPRRDEPEHAVHEDGARRGEAPPGIRDPLRLARRPRGKGHRISFPGSRIHVREVPGDSGGRADPETPPQAPFPEGMDLQPDPVADSSGPAGQPEQGRDREPPQVIRGGSMGTTQ